MCYCLVPKLKTVRSKKSTSTRKQENDNKIASCSHGGWFFTNFLNIVLFYNKKLEWKEDIFIYPFSLFNQALSLIATFQSTPVYRFSSNFCLLSFPFFHQWTLFFSLSKLHSVALGFSSSPFLQKGVEQISHQMLRKGKMHFLFFFLIFSFYLFH